MIVTFYVIFILLHIIHFVFYFNFIIFYFNTYLFIFRCLHIDTQNTNDLISIANKKY